jgi:hypothetical protein
MKDTVTDIGRILRQKLNVFHDFFSVTNLLKDALEKKAMEEAGCLLSRRDELVQVIDSLDRKMVRLRQGSFQATHTMTDLFREIERILKQIVVVNQECLSLAEVTCRDLRGNLASAHQTGIGIRKYASGVQRVQKFLDIKT